MARPSFAVSRDEPPKDPGDRRAPVEEIGGSGPEWSHRARASVQVRRRRLPYPGKRKRSNAAGMAAKPHTGFMISRAIARPALRAGLIVRPPQFRPEWADEGGPSTGDLSIGRTP